MYICTYIFHKHQPFMLNSQTVWTSLGKGSGSQGGYPVPGRFPIVSFAEVGFGLLHLWPQQHPFDVTWDDFFRWEKRKNSVICSERNKKMQQMRFGDVLIWRHMLILLIDLRKVVLVSIYLDSVIAAYLLI